ncbi:Uncharacterized protein dnm_095860 [Desulfonema magnum]|uniref:Uncharacterized protein n=1 Tax=Desulfonema magnum TaxID=45655 RepID=A0A975BXJ0_9BACT|nr:Uncharacterized protein dnm_095860 [Desulfonema magnum]
MSRKAENLSNEEKDADDNEFRGGTETAQAPRGRHIYSGKYAASAGLGGTA